MIYSASLPRGAEGIVLSTEVQRHITFAIVGALLMIGMARIDYRLIDALGWFAYGFGVLVLVLVLLVGSDEFRRAALVRSRLHRGAGVRNRQADDDPRPGQVPHRLSRSAAGMAHLRCVAGDRCGAGVPGLPRARRGQRGRLRGALAGDDGVRGRAAAPLRHARGAGTLHDSRRARGRGPGLSARPDSRLHRPHDGPAGRRLQRDPG